MLAKQAQPSVSLLKFTVDKKCKKTYYRDHHTLWKMEHIPNTFHHPQLLPLALGQACSTLIKISWTKPSPPGTVNYM